jgi:hypothetical protein
MGREHAVKMGRSTLKMGSSKGARCSSLHAPLCTLLSPLPSSPTHREHAVKMSRGRCEDGQARCEDGREHAVRMGKEHAVKMGTV